MASIFRRLFGGSKQRQDTSVDAPLDEQAEMHVGDRVRDAFGNQGNVTEIDPNAEHGMGIIKVQFDDGREASLALVASGLERVDSE